MFPIKLNFNFMKLENYEGIYFLIGILGGLIFFIYQLKKENLDLDIMFEAIFYSLISALLMGKLFSVFFWNTQDFFKHPFEVLKSCSGISVTGGVLGGLVAALVYFRIKKLNFFYHTKFAIPSILMGHIVGRFGCFLNGDAGGMPTSVFWGLKFNPESVAYMPYTNIEPGTPIHPTQLYEMLGTFILLMFVIFSGKNDWITKRRIIWYAIGYSTIRFIVEFFRGDSERWGWIKFLTTGQLICLSGLAIGISLLIWSIFNDDKLDAKEENIARIGRINKFKRKK